MRVRSESLGYLVVILALLPALGCHQEKLTCVCAGGGALHSGPTRHDQSYQTRAQAEDTCRAFSPLYGDCALHVTPR